jgi:excisionase family DNA binding protein
MIETQSIIERLEKIELLITKQNLLQKEMFTLAEASNYLGISNSHAYKLTSGRQIPHFCPNGKKLYFKKSELDQWLQRNRKVSREELDTEAAKYLFNNRKS